MPVLMSPTPPPARHDLRALLPAVLALTLAVAIASINPVGYVGGSDDLQYLEAARCVAREEFCVPHTHWAARLPLVVPTAAVLAALGESRTHVMLVPIAYGLAAILLFVTVVQRAAGRTAAALAGVALAATPTVGGELTALGVSAVEFFWAIAAAFAWQHGLLARHRGWAAIAGAALGLALLSRATAFAFLPVCAVSLLFATRQTRAFVPPALSGLAVVLALEAAMYAATTSNPLHGWMLSLGHTRLPSSESPVAHLVGSPILNPAVIAGWNRSMGIDVHWTIDGALNLLADPTIAPNLWAALGLLFLARDKSVRVPLLLLGAACLYFGVLTYAMAIDPKPRMFVPVAAAACAIFGLCGARLWNERARALILAMLAMLTLNVAAIAYNKLGMRALERTAAAWAAAWAAAGGAAAGAGRGMAVDGAAQSVLTLVPQVRRLPLYTTHTAPSRLLTVSQGSCAAGPGWSLARARRFGMNDPTPLAALRARGIALGPVAPLTLCEFSLDRGVGRDREVERNREVGPPR